jgi:hypothetical protein
MQKTDQLNELFKRWEDHYRGFNIDAKGFSRDGIINETMYNVAPHKILFILRETDAVTGRDVREDLANGPRWPLFHQVAKWAWGILYNFQDFGQINSSNKLMKDALLSTAIMNVKKFTGTATTNFGLLNAFAFIDREFIRDEIKIIAPDLIICCNTFSEIMWALEIDEIRNNIHDQANVFRRVYTFNNAKIVSWPHHPADRKSHEKNYMEMAALFKDLQPSLWQ